MDTQNLTLRLPKPLLQKAKRLAAERGTSLTGLVIEGLTRATSGDQAYQQAWQRQRALMQQAEPRRAPGDSSPSRDGAHER